MWVRKRETVSNLQYIYDLDFLYQKEENCIIPTLCSWSRMCASERRKLYHIYSMFMFLILCIRKYQKEGNWIIPTICLYSRFVYQKELNCIIPTICLCSIFCVSEREKLYHTYSMFMFLILCIRKYQKEGHCIMHTLCLCSRLCVSEREKMYHTYSGLSI